MEPVFVSIEPTDRYFIVEQRWFMDKRHIPGHGCGTSALRDDKNGYSIPCAYVHDGRGGANAYTRTYNAWVENDNRRRSHGNPRMLFGFIFEAKNRTQIVEWLNDHGYTSELGGYPRYPTKSQIEKSRHSQYSITNYVPPALIKHKHQPRSVVVNDGIDAARISSAAANVIIVPNSQEGIVMPRTARDIRIDQLTRAMENAQQELTRILAQPKEPESDLIYFRKRFNAGGKQYTYAAVRTEDGLWFTTGPRTPKGFGWDELIDWIMEDDTAEIEVVTKRKPI